MYTWGADDAEQLGHGGGLIGGANVLQRLPTLVTTLTRYDGSSTRRWGGRPRGYPVDDGREVGCGRTFTALLTWGGEVWVWGRLAGRVMPKPTLIERLVNATIVGLVCGTDHIAMVTGDAARLNQRVEQEVHTDDVREAALARERAGMDKHVAEEAQHAIEEREKVAQAKADRLAEKRRVKLLGRLAKQRARQQGKDERRREAEAAKKAEADKAKAQEELGLEADKKPKGKKK